MLSSDRGGLQYNDYKHDSNVTLRLISYKMSRRERDFGRIQKHGRLTLYSSFSLIRLFALRSLTCS